MIRLSKFNRAAALAGGTVLLAAAGLYCVTNVPVDGQYWVYGNSVARPSHVGWVGCNYLFGDCPGT